MFERYRLVYQPVEWIDEVTVGPSGEPTVLLNRRFIGGERAAIRATKRAFRRQYSLEHPCETFRLFRVSNDGNATAIPLPKPGSMSCYPVRIKWSKDETCLELMS